MGVVRGGIEPPASAVSERRSGPTELPDTGTSCGTRTRFSALKGRKTNPYPNEAWWTCAASSGFEPESPGTKLRWVTDYPTRHDVSSLTRQDSNLNRLIQNQPCYRLHHGSRGRTCGGIRTPCARRQLLYRQPRLTLFASHAWHHRLPEQDSNLQSRINNPPVYRLTDRGMKLGHKRGDPDPSSDDAAGARPLVP